MCRDRVIDTEKKTFNADSRKSNADYRRFYQPLNPRLSVCNLRISALNRSFPLSRTSGITLIELMMSMLLLGIVIVGAWNVELAGRRFFTVSQKEAEVLNLLSPVMEHIQKNIYNGTGYIDLWGAKVTNNNKRLQIRKGSLSDYSFSAYRWRENKNQILFYSDFIGDWDNNYEVISNNIVNCTFNLLEDNRVEINLSACYDPNKTLSVCGSRDNPAVALNSSVTLRSMSIH